LNTTDEAVEVKKMKKKELIPPCRCIAGVVIVFVCVHLAGVMPVMIVFIDLEV